MYSARSSVSAEHKMSLSERHGKSVECASSCCKSATRGMSNSRKVLRYNWGISFSQAMAESLRPYKSFWCLAWVAHCLKLFHVIENEWYNSYIQGTAWNWAGINTSIDHDNIIRMNCLFQHRYGISACFPYSDSTGLITGILRFLISCLLVDDLRIYNLINYHASWMPEG